MASMMLHAAVLAFTTVTTPAYNPANPPEEAPPSIFGLILGLVVLGVVIVAVTAGLRYQERRRVRSRAAPTAQDPLAREALLAGVRLFCELEPAWAARDWTRLSRLLAPELLHHWRLRLSHSSADSVAVDGPASFEYVGPTVPGVAGERRVVLRVQGRLRARSSKLALSGRQRKGLLAVAAAILIASLVGTALAPATKIRSSGPSTIIVRRGVPVGGVHRLSYRADSIIDLTLLSDRADEVHLHGYDLHRQLPAGGAARLRFRATIEGSFPVELEQRGQTLAEVTVRP